MLTLGRHIILQCLLIIATVSSPLQAATISTATTMGEDTVLVVSSSGEDSVSIMFAGDVLFDRGVRRRMQQVGNDSIMSQVRSLFMQQDAVVVNLECPLSHRSHHVSKQIVFRADTLMAAVMRRNGVTHAALANNHSVDMGYSGLSDTYLALKAHGIVPMGYGLNHAERMAPVMIGKGNIQVAVFNNDVVPIENWPHAPADKPDILNVSTDSLCNYISRYHSENPTVPIVVVLHWGTEFSTSPTIQQNLDAIKLAKSGVSAIVGHHPHVVQPMRYVAGIPVFFSLGNFIFDQKRPGTNSTIALQLTFTKSGLTSFHTYDIKINDCIPQVGN